MPAFARTKLVMFDNCFEEKPGEIYLRYVGPNPGKLYHSIYNLIKSIWRCSDGDIQEESYNWGKKGDGVKFKIRWYMHRDLDKFTYYWIRFDLTGEGDDKNGKAFLKFKPVLMTEYPQDTVWQRSLFYEMIRTIYHKIFYSKIRRSYIEDCRDLTALFTKKSKEFFDALRKGLEDEVTNGG